MTNSSQNNNQSNKDIEDVMLIKYTKLFNEKELTLVEYRRFLKRLLKFKLFNQFDIVMNRYVELLQIYNLLEKNQNDKFVASIKLSSYLKQENVIEAAEYAEYLTKPDVINFENPSFEDLDAMLQISLYQVEIGQAALAMQILPLAIREIEQRENLSHDYKMLRAESFSIMAIYSRAIGNEENVKECEYMAYVGDIAFSQELDLDIKG